MLGEGSAELAPYAEEGRVLGVEHSFGVLLGVVASILDYRPLCAG